MPISQADQAKIAEIKKLKLLKRLPLLLEDSVFDGKDEITGYLKGRPLNPEHIAEIHEKTLELPSKIVGILRQIKISYHPDKVKQALGGEKSDFCVEFLLTRANQVFTYIADMEQKIPASGNYEYKKTEKPSAAVSKPKRSALVNQNQHFDLIGKILRRK